MDHFSSGLDSRFWKLESGVHVGMYFFALSKLMPEFIFVPSRIFQMERYLKVSLLLACRDRVHLCLMAILPFSWPCRSSADHADAELGDESQMLRERSSSVSFPPQQFPLHPQVTYTVSFCCGVHSFHERTQSWVYDWTSNSLSGSAPCLCRSLWVATQYFFVPLHHLTTVPWW